MASKSDNPHMNHRERMRQRFMEHGLDNFSDHNVLELLLFYVLGRRDTNVVAHRLLDTFGTLDAVFDAPPEELRKVKDVGDKTAVFLHLIPEVARRYLMAKAEPGRILNNSDAAGRYLLPRFMTCQEERMVLVCMDAKLKVLDCREVTRGSTVSVSVDIRQIVQIALSQNATYVLLAHNHTSGIALPSNDDIAVTLHVRQVLAEVGVTLTDHIVVAGGDFVSMADSGIIPPL